MSNNHRHAQQAECKRILSSGIFSPGSNPARFLEYVCASYFEGKSAVSEHTIAVEALGRRPDFDPQQDAIVRVEASRVRKRLSEYYHHEGVDDDMMLVIPMGSYLPTFVAHEKVTEEGQSSLVSPLSRGWGVHSWKLIAFLGLIVLIAATATIWMWIRHLSTLRSQPISNRTPVVGSPPPQQRSESWQGLPRAITQIAWVTRGRQTLTFMEAKPGTRHFEDIPDPESATVLDFPARP